MLAKLLELRPFAYHCCGEANFASIRNARSIRSTASLLAGSEYEELTRQRRPKSILAALPIGVIEIRDNFPLRLGSLELDEGMKLEEFLYELNSRVFFWPGDENGPIPTGRRHFEHYEGEGAVHLIRVPLASLLNDNPDKTLFVSFCNSGSARHQQGRPVRRGKSTFSIPTEATRPAYEVKEFTFIGEARLPESAQWTSSLSAQWLPL